jgi:hypothetical protein
VSRPTRSQPRLDLVTSRPRQRDGPTSTPVTLESETRYLDLDGDGLLDAVEVTERVVSLGAGDGERRTLQTIRSLAAGIEEDGEPRLVTSSAF